MQIFKIISFSIIALTISLSLISYYSTFTDQQLIDHNVCFTSTCVKNFAETFSGTINILSAGMHVLWIFAAVFGVYIALNGYINNTKSTALSGYINHIRLFRDYIQEQAKNLKRVNLENIDIHIWYELAFPNSKAGDVRASDAYLTVSNEILNAIKQSNRNLRPGGDRFLYLEHQNRIISALVPLGINVTTMPKNDFLAMENDLLSLLDSVNRTFANNLPEFRAIKRLYL